jgi:hypothetical protein
MYFFTDVYEPSVRKTRIVNKGQEPGTVCFHSTKLVNFIVFGTSHLIIIYVIKSI